MKKWQRQQQNIRESSTPRTQHPHRELIDRGHHQIQGFSAVWLQTKKFHLSSTAQLLFEKVSLSFEVGKEEATISLVKPHNSSFLNGQKLQQMHTKTHDPKQGKLTRLFLNPIKITIIFYYCSCFPISRLISSCLSLFFSMETLDFVVGTRLVLTFFIVDQISDLLMIWLDFLYTAHDFIRYSFFSFYTGSVRTNWDNEKLWWYQ